MTYFDRARQIWPGLSDEQAHRLLINVTCYPFGPDIWVWEQLQAAYESSGGDVELAIRQVHEELERDMLEYAQREGLISDLAYDSDDAVTMPQGGE